MATSEKHHDIFMLILLWAARSLAVFCIWIALHFLVTLGPDLMYIAVEEMALILLLLLAFLSSMMLASEKEMIGGALAVLSVAAFCLIYGPALEVSIGQATWILIFAAPGLLFILHGASSSLSESRCRPSLP